MADFNEYYQKGAVLMQQALKKLAEEDYEGFDADREEANKNFDLAMIEMQSDQGKLTQLYGESRNFGVIYNVFEQNIVNLLKKRNGKNIIKRIYEAIKNNEVLHDQFKAYNSYENLPSIADGITEKKELSTALLNTIPNHYSRKEVVEANEKLIGILRRYGLNELVDIPEDTENLYEAIESVMIKNKSINDLQKQTKAIKYLNEYVNRCCDTHSENVNNEESFKQFNEEYKTAESSISEEINDDEKNLIEKYLNPRTNKQEFFESTKRDTLRNLKKAMNESSDEDKKEWSKVISQIENTEFNENDGLSLVAEMIEINNTL